jgi:hypothetical protein
MFIKAFTWLQGALMFSSPRGSCDEASDQDYCGEILGYWSHYCQLLSCTKAPDGEARSECHVPREVTLSHRLCRLVSLIALYNKSSKSVEQIRGHATEVSLHGVADAVIGANFYIPK